MADLRGAHEESAIAGGDERTKNLLARAGARLAYGGVFGIVQEADDPEGGTLPVFAQRAEGAWVVDTCGRRYVDWVVGSGAVALGHARAEVVAAIRAHAGIGSNLSLMHPLEVETAEAVLAFFPAAERVAFGKNGSDVTTAAARVARAATGRELILCCGFHGFHDWYAVSEPVRGVPACLQPLLQRFAYNDAKGLRALLEEHAGRVAAVMLEPVTTVEPAPGFLRAVRELTSEHGCLLVFDEMVTGFRLARGGAQERYGVTPDLTCIGKALGNGMPLSAILGAERFLQYLPHVGCQMTARGEVLSLAAAGASLAIHAREPVAERLAEIGRVIQDRFHALCRARGVPARLAGPPARMTFELPAIPGRDPQQVRLAFLRDCLRGGMITNGMVLPCAAHDAETIERTAAALRAAVERLAAAG